MIAADLARRLAEPVRFGLVLVLGLLIDLGTAWVLAAGFGVDLMIAVIAGFAAGTVSNYLVHEFWTFRNRRQQVSVRRVGLFAVTVGITLGVRLGILQAAIWLNGGKEQPFLLLFAYGASFLTNYATSKWLVFRPDPAPNPSLHASDQR